MDTVESLLKKLISVPSLTGNEIQFCDFLFDYLQQNELSPEKNPVDDNGYNIIVKIGNPKIFFCAHMDTVEPYLPFSEDDNNIYGRGSCDTKGSLASMVIACLNAKTHNLTDFGCIFTVGEESDFRGVNQLLKSKINTPYAIVGEPTSLEIVNGHYGILLLSLTTKGKAAHSSTPENGINAIDALLNVITKIRNELSIHPDSLMSLVKISGGVADNIIPDQAEALLSFRIAPTDKTDYQTVIQNIVKSNCTVNTDLTVSGIHNQVPKELTFISTHRSVRYMTELSMLKKGVVLGPGNISCAHSEHEYISKAELNKAVDVYLTIIQNFCK